MMVMIVVLMVNHCHYTTTATDIITTTSPYQIPVGKPPTKVLMDNL